jgi:hypothetical protein
MEIMQHLRLAMIMCISLTLAIVCAAGEQHLYVNPAGDDGANGSEETPFRTLFRAQAVARVLAKDMQGDIIVHMAPGDYRLDRTLIFAPEDSGRNGFRVIYRSEAGPGKARLLGSVPLRRWKANGDGIWTATLPPKTMFHTLYENGQRVHKARFPNLERDPDHPVALGRYLVSVDGTPIQKDTPPAEKSKSAWLLYRPEDAPPVTDVTKMRIHIYGRGKCDWVREVFPVEQIDAQACRLTIRGNPFGGVGANARFFLEDELGFLDTPGEFFLNEKTGTLSYLPLGEGHPDTLHITYPKLNRLIEIRGNGREQCVKDLTFEGLSFEETDNSPPLALWAYAGHRDGALVWMTNTANIIFRDCHLKNSGRSGIMMLGQNTNNLVTGCWIEHTGLNGISLCNRFLAADKKSPTLDRCEHNHISNTHISHVGELHTYAECVTLFNVSDNEIDHCELDNSVRYAVTLRGNTGPQYGPPVTTAFPPTARNWIHHVRIDRCGQDGGDMGALHTASLNNPGGESVNTFEQITITDTSTIPSSKDWPPDGIFIDWPKMSMDQVFRNIEVLRSQGKPFRSHGKDNEESAITENVSWKPGFKTDLMDYKHIGLTGDFPAEYKQAREPRPGSETHGRSKP